MAGSSARQYTLADLPIEILRVIMQKLDIKSLMFLYQVLPQPTEKVIDERIEQRRQALLADPKNLKEASPYMKKFLPSIQDMAEKYLGKKLVGDNEPVDRWSIRKSDLPEWHEVNPAEGRPSRIIFRRDWFTVWTDEYDGTIERVAWD